MFIIEGLRLKKGLLPDNGYWLFDNEILLKEIDNKLSAFVISKRDDSFAITEEDYKRIGHDREKKKLADDKWKELEEEASKKIQSYIRLYPVLTKKSPAIVYSGSRQIASVGDTGKSPYSVVGSIVITPRFLLNEIILRKTIELYKDMKELHDKFPFLDIASKYYYQAIKPVIDELEFGKFDSRQFVDAMIVLECLYNDGSTDIKHKLSLRNASVLGFLGYNRKKVFEDTKILYDKRNDIVHGLIPKLSRRPILDDTHRLLDCAGKSLTCSYILYGSRSITSKTGLMGELDETLLVYSKQLKMRKEIVSGISRF